LPVRLGTWATGQMQAALASLGRLWRNPLPSILGTTVIGVALALPAFLFTLLDNVRAVTEGWSHGTELTLYLTDTATLEQGRELALALQQDSRITEVSVIDPDLALVGFQTLAGFGPALDALEENPLPVALVVTPSTDLRDRRTLSALAASLGQLPAVAIAQFDAEWVTRLQALLRLSRNAVVAIGALLGIAVLLVVGNTIRLDIENRREEIVVVKLVGGTDTFLRRPFLFGGAWLGISGGLCAWVLVNLTLVALAGPVGEVAALYASQFNLSGPGLAGLLDLVSAGVILGILGAWLAVGQQLRRIEPQ